MFLEGFLFKYLMDRHDSSFTSHPNLCQIVKHVFLKMLNYSFKTFKNQTFKNQTFPPRIVIYHINNV